MNYFNYFSEIESAFIRRRGRNLLLSPLDWELIETWQEREVPLHIVLRGIEKVFDGVDKQPARKRTIKSLTYCREEIEAQYAEWLESQIGKVQDSGFRIQDSNVIEEDSKESVLFADDATIAHLEKVSGELKSALNKAKNELNQTLKKVLTRLAQLRETFSDAETLEKDLEKLDALIDDSILKHCSTDKLKAEIEKELALYKNKMEIEVYQRTYNLMLLKRLREQAEIPRLSLFYL